jgi:phospholipid-binding lipoprotein MlaA
MPLVGRNDHHSLIHRICQYKKEKGIPTMKRLSLLTLLMAFLVAACAHSPSPSLSSPTESFEAELVTVASNTGQMALTKSPEVSLASGSGSVDAEGSVKSGNEGADKEGNPAEEELGEEEKATIADPLEPFNRAMYHFNDKLYFWALKPVARGYKLVVPEPARVGVKNFFSNLAFPVRFVSCLLQADFSGAAAELGRFAVNTIWGVGGLLDPSSNKDLNIPKRDADFGQTLGIYGVGQGFYIVWPVVGPSSARDSVGIVGDFFLYPVSYITPWYDWLAVRAYEEVNDTSLRIGDYESLKEAAIDPYVALRDAYSQYRQKKIEERRGKPGSPKPAGVR